MPKLVIDEEKGLQAEKKDKEAPKNEFRRTTLHGDVEIELRVVPPSKEAVKALGMRTRRTIVGPFGINPLYYEKKFGKKKTEMLRSIAEMKSNVERETWLKKNAPVDFVENKEEMGYKQFLVKCVQCGEDIATVWAKDETLIDWCDLHYITAHDKNTWYGTMSINVSPIDQRLGFECTCGEDTRDYRANRQLPPVMRNLMSEYSLKHRDFGMPNSAFIAVKL